MKETRTPFEEAVKEAKAGNLRVPKVSNGTKDIPYFQYQLAVHKFNLSLMSKGISCRGIKLKDLKAYYGLSARSAKDCLTQFNLIKEKYEKLEI
jgi:hypothetical protein